MNVVWFKRDLRVDDHEPLVRAAAVGPCVLLYIHEPSILAGTDTDAIHVHAIDVALAELEQALETRYGMRITYRVGEAVEVLEALHRAQPVETLFSHEETGNAATYARDLAVKRWARDRGVAWNEYAQFGVIRPLRTRDGWAKRWERRMGSEPIAGPARIVVASGIEPHSRSSPIALGFELARDRAVQPTGVTQARADLASFLAERGTTYRRAMSSPLTGEWACSRLSSHLATGSISLRTVTTGCAKTSSTKRALRHGPRGERVFRWSMRVCGRFARRVG